MSRKKDLPTLEKVTITGIGAEGNAVARVDNMVVFVPALIPGDIVDIKVVKKRKNFLEGRAVKFHEYSPDRQQPKCRHFGVCGGCRWQHLPYNLQLEWKSKQVADSLARIGKIDNPVLEPIIGSADIYNYRNKLEYSFSNKRWLTDEEIKFENEIYREPALGFHIPGRFDKILDIEECWLQPEPSNLIRNEIKRFAIENRLDFFDLKNHSGFLRNIIIRNTLQGEVMVIVVFFEDDTGKRTKLLDFIANNFPAVTSLYYIINSKRNSSLTDREPILYNGVSYLTEYMDGLQFRIGPKTFCQTNTRQGIELYRKVKEFATLSGSEIVYDLYTGAGTIANYVAGNAGKVIGIEYVTEAVADAEINSTINNISNTAFFAGDIKDILSENFFAENGTPDVIITDPPRAGMHADVVKAILFANPSKIVYVSCNPATQARDLQMMSDFYSVTKIQPVDMFPHTYHVENVVLLERIDN